MRILPQNLDAEESVLGAILLDPEAIGRVIDRLELRAFSLSAHQKIYQTTVILHQQNKPTDLMTVTTWLLDHNLLDEIGGQFKLAQLVERTVSAVNIELYAGYVMDKYIRRELIHAGHEIAELGYDTTRELPIILDEAEQKVFKLNQSQAKSGLVHISQTLISAFKELEMRSENDFLPGVASGFYDLDGMTGGFQRSDLIIIAGRPSMGKTSFALNIAEKISQKYKLPVAIFSLEMSKEQLTQRLLTSDSHIESKKFKSERLSLDEWDKITKSSGKLSELSVYIDDTPNMTVTQVRSEARKLQSDTKQELGLILIDYLQLMEGGGDNRVQEISKITRSLKGLAREFRVPVIVLSQLSRSVESRTNKRPMMSDLRESGCISGDSLITLADSGERIAIKDLVNQSNFKIWAVNEKTMKLESALVSNVFSTGKKAVFTLKTRLGRTIKTTANHQFLTIEGWKRLDQLNIGEHIALPRYIQSSSLQLMSDDIYWDSIISITENGIEEVFDITVPTLHNFVANDIIVHNSIEQDADLILMLYRDSYYNPDSPDQNITEILITKHRNGPTGVVKLLFDPMLTEFKNLAHPKEY